MFLPTFLLKIILVLVFEFRMKIENFIISFFNFVKLLVVRQIKYRHQFYFECYISQAGE